MLTLLSVRGYGATVARLTPDQTVGGSNPSGLILATGFSVGYRLKATATGFEPVRAKPIGFQVQLLNLSDTLSTSLLWREIRQVRGAQTYAGISRVIKA